MEIWDEIWESQAADWDCGLACCQMAINYQSIVGGGGREGPSGTLRIDTSNFNSYPLWTIDLCAVLRDFGVKHRMYTLCAGIGPHHYEMDWYETNLEEDAKRVEALFRQAQIEDWGVHEQDSSTQDVIDHINGGGLCIVLVDATSLRNRHVPQGLRGTHVPLGTLGTLCTTHESEQGKGAPGMDVGERQSSPAGVSSLEDECDIISPKSNYCGHYIMLCGYDESTKYFTFLDPSLAGHNSSTDHVNSISLSVFDSAWSVPGTDKVNPNPNPSPNRNRNPIKYTETLT